jgi:hypothetical protein
MLSIEDIQTNSARLRELNHEIHETFRKRDKGPQELANWEAACAAFHKHFDDLCFPGGAAVLEQIRSGDSAAVESAIRFLTADPRHFRSGYLKEFVWRVIPRLNLSAADIERLEGVAFNYLQKQISREFWYMCRAMARVGTQKLWQRVTQQLGNGDPLVAKRASYLLAFSASVHAGAVIRRQVYRDVIREKYGRG